MRFDIISANPAILKSSLTTGLIGRACEKGYVEIYVHNLRDYAEGSYKQIDDEPYGGGAGMILKPEPFFRCIKELQSQREYDEVIYFSPQGDIYDQKIANFYSLKNSFLLLCGHYKGIDERVIEKFVTREISIGNYVISCGDIAALVFIDSVSRLIPGVLHDSESAITDSFQVETIFDSPHYTRPAEYEGMKVPEVLLSGNHKQIEEWRRQKALEKFQKRKKE
jgi:tRNA (guanine37-N1)-methyltransferase